MTFRDGWSYILAPMGVDEFLSRHWEPQKPLHLPGHSSKFADLLDRRSFVEAIQARPEEGKLQLRVSYTRPDDTFEEIGFIGGREAVEHFERGATICATALEYVEPAVREFRNILAEQWPSPDPLIVNCYYSPDGQGFGTHFDPQSVWVMQIEGRKRWHYSTDRAMPFPNDGKTAMELRPKGSPLLASAESMASVELQPGDVLYLPPGTWHRAEANGHSLALSVSQTNHGTRRLVSKVLRKRLFDDLKWRGHFPLSGAGSADVETYLSGLLGDLKTVVNNLTVADLRDVWALMALPQTTTGTNHPAPVTASDPLRVVQPLAAFADEPTQTLVVYRNGRKYDLPWSCRFVLNGGGTPLTGDAIAARLGAPWEEASPLILDLLQIGVLAHA